jgi:hypothetical protein
MPTSIYTLYEVTNQAKQILNTYPNDTEEIVIQGHYIHLFSEMYMEPLNTKEKYDRFHDYIFNIIKQPFDKSNQSQQLIRKICGDFLKITKMNIPNFDSCRWVLDLERFKNLKKINLSHVYLYEIKNIPNYIHTINIQYSFLKKIDELPPTLKEFFCSNNQLVKLPNFQNTQLEYINFTNNDVSIMPFLPNTVKILIFNNNQIVKIPVFPKSLKHLECSRNHIYELDTISKEITSIICDHNSIYKLPRLSDLYFLKTLICNANIITEIPPLPGLIEYIDYSENPVSIFVPFPYSLIE